MDPNTPGSGPARPPLTTYRDFAQMVEHTLVRHDLTEDEVAQGCHLAKEYGVAAVAVRPCDVELAARVLGGSGVQVAGIAGFPHGSSTTAAKLYEGRDLLRRGAKEINFVVNIGKMLSRQFQHVETEILQMAESCHQEGAILKVVCECAYLADDLKIILSKILKRTQADFADTSTCYGPGGYRLQDVQLLKRVLGDTVKIKASGGVRTLEKALEAYEAGCDRFGATFTAPILEEWKRRLAAQPKAAPNL